ncbi:MAG: hypothetical protein WAW71_05260, partial [Propioniciclava sp.]
MHPSRSDWTTVSLPRPGSRAVGEIRGRRVSAEGVPGYFWMVRGLTPRSDTMTETKTGDQSIRR